MQSSLKTMTVKPDLTPAEHQLLDALCTGATNKFMARDLGKSQFTVRNQLSSLFKKVNAENRTQAVSWYRQNGGTLHGL